MKRIVNGSIIRRRSLILASLITVITSTVILFGDYSTSLQLVSSISSQDQNSARFEAALLQQRQKAKSLVRNLSAEERFERLAAKVITDGEVRVITVLRVAFSPQTEVSKDVESFVQRFEIGRVRELLIDDLIGYDPSSIKRYDVLPILALTVNASGIEALRQSDKILDIQEDQMNQVSQSEGEALIGLAESVPLIGGTKAWASGFTGAGQTVAILDTGIDKNHPMLAGKVVSEACYSTNSGTLTSLCPDGASSSTANNSALPCDSGCEHGTQIAGIAAGKMVSYNGQTFAGVAKDANIIAIQVFSRQNDESICALNKETAPCYRSLTSDYIRGLDRVYSLSRSYSIASANLSLGLEANVTNCDSHVTKPIIDLLRVVNIATVIASGNNSYTNAINEPACISTAVSVGATVGESDIVASDSNSASILSLVAPGFGITSAIPRAKYGRWNGTSMAAPHVAGAWAIAKQKSPLATVQTILNAFKSTGVKIRDKKNSIISPRIAIDLALATLPNAPKSLNASPVSSTMINLTWVDTSSDESGFVLERKAGSGQFSRIASLPANTSSYNDSTVSQSTRYTYRLYSRNAIGSSSYSNETSATTHGPTAAPTNFTATTILTTQINLKWNDNANNETGYILYRRLNSGGSWTSITLPANARSYEDVGLTASTEYLYLVSAIAPGGARVDSPRVVSTTCALAEAPAMVTATAVSPTQINISWRNNANNKTGYAILRSTGSEPFLPLVPLDANVTSYQDKNLTPSSSYSYIVVALNPCREWFSAPAVNAITCAITAAPTFVTATRFSTTQINLSWQDNATNETGYRVTRRLTSGSSWTVVATLPPNTTSYSNTGLSVSTGYTYLIEAIASCGPPSGAPQVSVVTHSPTLAASDVTTKVISSTQINLFWKDNANNETGYIIQRSAGTLSSEMTVGANTTSFSDTGLKSKTSYTYRVFTIAPGGARISPANVTIGITK